MTKVEKYEIKEWSCTAPWYERLWDWICRRANRKTHIIQLVLANGVGVLPGNLVILSNSDKAVVVSAKGTTIIVKTIKAVREVKPIRGVKLLSRKWKNDNVK